MGFFFIKRNRASPLTKSSGTTIIVIFLKKALFLYTKGMFAKGGGGCGKTVVR